jgi:hypothetical protein
MRRFGARIVLIARSKSRGKRSSRGFTKKHQTSRIPRRFGCDAMRDIQVLFSLTVSLFLYKKVGNYYLP